MRKLLLVLVLLCGCYSQLNQVGHLLPKEQRPYIKKYTKGVPSWRRSGPIREHHKTVESIKKYYFTSEAYGAIKDIPAIDGAGYSPWVTGVNFWSSLLGIVSLNGASRQVIAPAEMLRYKNFGVYVFIHEYIHHLDDLTRDGEGDWVDIEEFKKAYGMMANDNKYLHIGGGRHVKIYNYPHIIKEVENKANAFVTDVFGIGDWSEHIAYVGQLLIQKGGPQYMWYVYRKILKRH